MPPPTFDINEVMLTKIERGHEDYDVVCPSEYIIERMLRKDLLLPIDTAFGKTPNYISNVSPYIVEQIDATSNNGRIAHHYAVPYMWGTCGASPTIMPCLTCGEPVASYIIRCTYL